MRITPVKAFRVLFTLVALATLAAIAPDTAQAQRRTEGDRYDDVFRKYGKRYFGIGFDWRYFKAQGLAESNLNEKAESYVGARGIMQLMPTTFAEISTQNPQMAHIDDPEWNIAAGIFYDRQLWRAWADDSVEVHRPEFMFGSYNAGRGTILKAQMTARASKLDARQWPSIEEVAPKVSRWRYRETLDYVKRIHGNMTRLDDKGRLRPPGKLPAGVIR